MTYLTPMKAIRRKCLGCAGSKSAVRRCDDFQCPLHDYRMGCNPSRQGIGKIESLRKNSHSTSDSKTISRDEYQGSHEMRSSIVGHLRTPQLRLVGAEAGA
jgi:hypothetical protein